MSAGMPQLDFATFPSQIFWLFLCFSLLCLLAAKWFLPAVADVLEERKNRIDGDLSRAKKLSQEAEQLRYECEIALQKARAEANKALQGTANGIKQMQDERVHKLEESLSHQMQEAEIRMRKLRKDSLHDMEAMAIALANDIAQKIASELKTPVASKEHIA